MILEAVANLILGPLTESVDLSAGEIDSDDVLYRRLSGGSRRDLSPVAQDRAVEVSHYLWRTNPLAKRIVEMMLDMTVGDGITFEVTASTPSGEPDEAAANDATKVVEQFWADPQMRLDLRHRDLIRDLALNGELVLRAFTGTGTVALGYIDPARIKSVEKDPYNLFVDSAVILKPKNPGEPDVRLEVLQARIDPVSGQREYLGGDTFFYGINRLTSSHRGVPDLLALADWIDGYDQIMFNAVDRSALMNAFIWDVTLAGADEKVIQQWIEDHGDAPRPGTTRVHNDSETWQAVTPGLGAFETEHVARMVKNLILGGAGVPEAWFAEGDSANRATLAEQGAPTYRMIQARQKIIKAIFEDLLSYVVSVAQKAGRIPARAEITVNVSLPEPSAEDTTEFQQALPSLVNALMTAIGEQFISRESARSLFLMMAGGLGMEFDAADEAEKIEQESEAEAQEQQRQINELRAQMERDPETAALAMQKAGLRPPQAGDDTGEDDDAPR